MLKGGNNFEKYRTLLPYYSWPSLNMLNKANLFAKKLWPHLREMALDEGGEINTLIMLIGVVEKIYDLIRECGLC